MENNQKIKFLDKKIETLESKLNIYTEMNDKNTLEQEELNKTIKSKEKKMKKLEK